MLKEIKIGDRIVLFGKMYRILIKHRGLILMIEMNVDKMIFRWEHETVLSAFLNRGEAVIDTSEEKRYPIERLSDDEKASIQIIRNYIEGMLNDLYPAWDILASRKAKPEYQILKNKIGCSKSTLARYLRYYLQSGRNEYSLMDKRKMNTGSKESKTLRGAKPKYYDPNRIENDDKLKDIFEEYFNRFLNSSEKLTLQAVYDEMIAEHFENTALAPPTYRRFNYFVNQRLEEEHMTLAQAKMNARERRNNHRLLKGNAQSGVYYPGQMLARSMNQRSFPACVRRWELTIILLRRLPEALKVRWSSFSISFKLVKYFNRQIRPNYPYTREMIESGIDQCPMAIWEYGIRNIQSPRQVTDENRDMLYFALLRNDIPFRVSGKGITYKGLYYWDESRWFLELRMKMNREGKNSAKISGLRYDPRLVDRIYRMENGRMVAIPLNCLRDEQKSFLGMSWKEYLELYEMKKENEAAYRPINDQYRREAKKETRKIVDAAKAVKALGSSESKGKNKTTEIRAARKEDGRELVRRDADAKGKLLLSEPEVPGPAAAEIRQDTPMQPASMEEFLKMTEELSKFN